MGYFLAINGQQQGPFDAQELLHHGMQPDTLVWKKGMAQWMPASAVPELAGLFQTAPSPAFATAGAGPVGYYGAPASPIHSVNGTKIAAGICGIFLGSLGIHKFILGRTGAGVTMLLITFFTLGFGALAMHVIGIIEGILYLSKSDAEFYQIYVVGKKAWF